MGRKSLAKKQKELNEKEMIKNILLTKSKTLQRKKEEPDEPLIKDIESFRCHFIRSEDKFLLKTKSKIREKQLKELVRYVFHKYTVPEFMFDIWVSKNTNNIRRQFDFKQWYICVAKGGSLYKEFAKDLLTKKETHLFLNCSHTVSIEEAVVYSIAKAEGVSDGIALRIAKTKINDKEITDYWKDNIRWFAKNTPESIKVVNDLVDYLVAKKLESPNFTLMGAGFTLVSLLKKMHDWHYDLRRLKAIGEANWEGHPINDSKYTYIDQYNVEYAWNFYQIKSAKELQEEGNSQRHCVLSYKDSCIKGICSIWSLKLGFLDDTKKQSKRKLTIEVRNDGRIVQIRGLANRSIKNDEKNIVDKWAKDNGLHVSNYF